MSSIGTFGSYTLARLAIYASQAGLSVTGNNSANINTYGYTRQRLEQSSFYAGGADRYYSSFGARTGNGVLCTGVSQLRDPYLDIRYQLQILKLIRQLNQEYGITIVMVLHDINQSLYYSNEIVAMKDGKMIAHGLPEEIITSELVKEVYDVDLNIQSVDGKPFVIPV